VSIKDNGVVRHYDVLSPAERHRLALEARARHDEQEWDRLVASCPIARKRDGSPVLFEVTEPAFTERWDASHALAVAVALALAPQLARLALLRVIPDLFEGALAVGVAAGWGARRSDEGEMDESEINEAVGDLPAIRACRQVAEEKRAEAAAVYGAFAATCREEMGIAPETVLQAHLGVLPIGLEALEGAEPDQEQLAAWQELFARKWREHIGR
jgi:hypothetical protein